jgi:hypothetical protein
MDTSRPGQMGPVPFGVDVSKFATVFLEAFFLCTHITITFTRTN